MLVVLSNCSFEDKARVDKLDRFHLNFSQLALRCSDVFQPIVNPGRIRWLGNDSKRTDYYVREWRLCS